MKQSILVLSAMVLAPLTGWSATPKPVRILVWDERQPEQKQAYAGRFIGETIAAHLSSQSGLVVKSVCLADPEQGVSEATLDATDVVIWWSHKRNSEVTDEHAQRIVSRVLDGKLDLIALHSAHWAKPFVRLMQERAKSDALAQVPEAERATTKWRFLLDQPYGKLPEIDAPLTPALTREGNVWTLTLPACVFPSYRADGKPSHVKTLLPKHPIAAGLPATWDIPQTEMYGEPFHIPTPDDVVFEERWDKGEHFRSGCIWNFGKSRVFYFRPGHETYPIFRQPLPLKVLTNAVRWLGSETSEP